MNSKKISILLASMILLSPIVSSTTASAIEDTSIIDVSKDSSDVVTIKDIGLQKTLSRYFKKAQTDTFTKKELESIKVLNLTDNVIGSFPISDITGIEYCTNLESLTFSADKDVDLTPIASLKKLTNLDLAYSKSTDFSPIYNLTNLKSLRVNNTDISDISFLSNMKELTSLDLSSTDKVKDYSIVSSLTNLTNLDLGWNKDVTPSIVSNLTKLEVLDMASTNLTTVNFLSNLKSLTSLNLCCNKIKEISKLSDLSNLTNLDLGSNAIVDLSCLSKLTDLTELDLSSNKVFDLSPLSSLIDLTRLQLSNNEISDVTPITSLPKLWELTLSGNNLLDIQPLLKLKKQLFHTSLEDQKITLPLVECVDELEIPNPLVSDAGTPIVPTNVSDGGIYDENTNTIKWTNLTETEKDFSFTFSQEISEFFIPVGASGIYSGTVTFPVKVYSNEDDLKTVNIPDKALKEMIREELNLSHNEEVTVSDMKLITNLYSSGNKYGLIKDLTGLEYCTNLEELLLPYNDISDLSPLKGLNKLRSVNLDCNKISDISPLSDELKSYNDFYAKKQRVDIEQKESKNGSLTIDNPIVDFNGVPMVPKTISHNGTYDKESNTITWHNLTCDTNELKLHYYNIQDENCYSPWLDEDPDYMPIPGIPVGYTTTLNIPVNVTATADNAAVIPDKALKDSILKELNKTDDYVITRKDMESITSLNLANKKIYNIEGLQLCSNLKTIDLSNNRISKIVPLSNLKNIESVNLSNNRIDDISCLYGNTTTLPKYDITNQNVILPFATYNGYYYRLPNAITFILTTYLLIL